MKILLTGGAGYVGMRVFAGCLSGGMIPSHTIAFSRVILRRCPILLID